MAYSPKCVPNKLIVDSVIGDIHLCPREWLILDTLPFQRLRSIKQLQMGHVTYPNATHTRFAHSLGTLGIMARILDAVQSNGSIELDPREAENLRMAALLHDIGHYPYSHLMEGLDSVTLTEEAVGETSASSRSFDASQLGYPNHERVGTEIVTNQADLVEAIGGPERAKEVADLFSRAKAANPQLSKLLHSSFDMDRVDYLQRDSLAAGVPYGNIDVNYLLNSLRISKSGMVGVAQKALPAAEQFLLARFFMHKTVYFHKTTFGIEEACRQLLRRIRDASKFKMPCRGADILNLVRSAELAGFTDAYVDGLVHQASQDDDPIIRSLARSIENRQPPKLLKEVQIFEDSKHITDNAGMVFWLKAKASLRALADKNKIPLGQFLLCKTKPLKLEQRGATMTAEQARSLPSEQEDELIKVFVNADTEPKSLVEIPHSVIHISAGYFWQAFRLYVVLEGPNNENVIHKLRDEVSAWR
jgi:HD superfamily phosphohydrolase